MNAPQDVSTSPKVGSPRTPAPREEALPRAERGSGPTGVAVLVLLLVLTALVGMWHLTQGTSGVGFGDLVRYLAGDRDSTGGAPVGEILTGSRLPRLFAGVAVGIALGSAGALLQSVTHNTLASPDTLAVSAGAYFMLSLVAAFGLSVPLWASGAVAFAAWPGSGGGRTGTRGTVRRHVGHPPDPRRIGDGHGPGLGDRDGPHPFQAEHDRPVRLGERFARPAEHRRVRTCLPARGRGAVRRPGAVPAARRDEPR